MTDFVGEALAEFRRALASPEADLGTLIRQIENHYAVRCRRALGEALRAELDAQWDGLPLERRTALLVSEVDFYRDVHAIVYGEGKTPSTAKLRQSLIEILGEKAAAAYQEEK